MLEFREDGSSEYLVHIVGKDISLDGFLGILSSGRIEARNKFGFQRENQTNKTVCFSEIPPNYLKQLIARRSNYGIAFKKSWLLSKGAQRVWYLEKGSPQHAALDLISSHPSKEITSAFALLTPFIDITGEFGSKKYRFDWEREWRTVGRLSFNPENVAFLILPQSEHADARYFFEQAEIEQVGPNYHCPYYDPITDIESE